MRFAALLVLAFGASGAKAQLDVAPPPRPAIDPILAAHLAAWRQEAATRTNYRFEVQLKRANPTFKLFNRDYRGTIAGMKPNLMRLRLEDTTDPMNYETFIATGKSLFGYSGLQKTVTEYKLTDWLAKSLLEQMGIQLMTGAILQSIPDRFEITLFKADDHYVYLDLKPRGAKEKLEFKQIRIALYGPKSQHAYLPAQAYVLMPNGETEQWMFRELHRNVPDFEASLFKYEDVPGFRVVKSGRK